MPRNHRNENVHSNMFTPRSYQVELLDKARKRNTIICLGTGTGKTFIAVMLIRELAHQVRKPLECGGMRSIFLTTSDDLVVQEATVVQLHTDLKVGVFVDNQDPTIWQKQDLLSEISNKHIMVMTAVRFLYILRQGYLSLTQVNLLVFDECHLSANDHPYVDIMKYHDVDAHKDSLRILGLTTSVLNNNCSTPDELEEHLHLLEDVLHCSAETATDIGVAEHYGDKAEEIVIESEEYIDETGLVEDFDHILNTTIDFLEDMNIPCGNQKKDPRQTPKMVLMECHHILHVLGPWCAGKVAHSLVKQLTALVNYESDTMTCHLLQLASTQLRIIHHVLEEAYDNQVMCLEDFQAYLSPRILHLVRILHKYKPDDNFVILGQDDMDDLGLGMGIHMVGSRMNGYQHDNNDSDDDDGSLLSDEEFDDGSNSKDVHMSKEKAGIHYVAIKKKDPEAKLNEVTEDGEGLCGLIFCERRHTAFMLNKLITELCNWDPDLFFLKSHYMTGHSRQTGKGKDSETLHKKQEDILRKFYHREINLLVSTSVLEEGVDVPRCNLVLRFDRLQNYRSYIQSKTLEVVSRYHDRQLQVTENARARANKSKFYMMVNSSDMEEFTEELRRFKGFERILMNKCVDEDTDSKENDKLCDDLLPAYVSKPGADSPRVTLSSAIALVNRYCAKLPSDAFTHLAPSCSVKVIDNGPVEMYRAVLQLPINSLIKEPIMGVTMKTKKLAKMAVALKTCETLHKEGELDDQLMPVGKEMIRYEDEENEWEEAEALGQPRPGTTKRKQYYLKRVANSLLGRPMPGCKAYLYKIQMTLSCPITEEQNTRGRRIYAPEESVRGFGLLCENFIPLVPSFPVFTRSGEVTVSLNLSSSQAVYTEEEITRMTRFHRFVFHKVLRLEKDPMMFDPDNAESSYIIVPVIHDGTELTVDWKFMDTIDKFPSKPKRRKFKKDDEVPESEVFEFRKENYENAVVMPSYRNVDQPQYFYVAEIRHDLNPQSPFPSPELYDTFEHYYSSKYGLKITSLEQPMLDVDHTSARLNLLTPRYMNQKGVALPTSSAETRRARRENLQQKQILIPELCDVHVFPACLWRKAVCLPAILYRINYLLLADEIRQMIACNAHIGVENVPENFKFEQLEFGFSTKPHSVIKQDEPSKKKIDLELSDATQANGDDQSEEESTLVLNSDQNEKDSDAKNVLPSKKESDLGQIAEKMDEIDIDITADEMSVEISTCEKNSLEKDKRILSVQDSETVTDKTADLKSGSTQLSHSTVSNSNQDKTADGQEHIPSCPPTDDTDISSVTPHNLSDDHQDEKSISDTSSNTTDCSSSEEKDIVISNSLTKSSSCPVFQTERQHILPPENLTSTIDFDKEENLETFLGPSPCIILQTLTMSNANDFFNLERLETIGDSFLKFAITVYLYCTYPGIHEGKLSYLRSKQVSNYNLYKLGKKKAFPDCMVVAKFEPMENWLPPGYVIKEEGAFKGLNVFIASSVTGQGKTPGGKRIQPPVNHRPVSEITVGKDITNDKCVSDDSDKENKDRTLQTTTKTPNPKIDTTEINSDVSSKQQLKFNKELAACTKIEDAEKLESIEDSNKCLIPYNLQTQHSLPDKSIADCVEALIGCYLTTCGQRAALQFMSWLGLKVLPEATSDEAATNNGRPTKNIKLSAMMAEASKPSQSTGFGELKPPQSPLLLHVPQASDKLEFYLDGYEKFEEIICYRFNDRSYLLQAFTHTSYHYNNITDCYQRLEFLGDAILDYVITRHLFEDPRKHSPGILTDLRSALVNNNIFAALAVKWNFHKYFKAISPQLFNVIDKFVSWQKERNDEINLDEEFGDMDDQDDESEGEKEDIEIPKALGDIFESVAGAIYLDSGMSLECVWKVYYRMMKPQIDAFTEKIPKSPVRELLEMEPETAKFEKPERTIDGKIRVTVNVVNKGPFRGIGRNYRIAKSAAAKRALKYIRLYQEEVQKMQKRQIEMMLAAGLMPPPRMHKR